MQTVTVYDWFKEIQPALCKKLNIPEDMFRDIINEKTKERVDLWLLALDSLIDDRMYNGSIVEMYVFDEEDFAEGEYDRGDTPFQKEWSKKLNLAWNDLCKELIKSNGIVYVKFWW